MERLCVMRHENGANLKRLETYDRLWDEQEGAT